MQEKTVGTAKNCKLFLHSSYKVYRNRTKAGHPEESRGCVKAAGSAENERRIKQ
jgi:hypothetical protein